MTKLKFSKSTLAGYPVPEPGKRVSIYDTVVPKLAMRITSAGSRTFYVIKRAGSSMAWVKLGVFPEMTVEQARTAAQQILAEFAKGSNPAAARRAIREEFSFLEVLEEMLLKKRKRDGSRITERTRKDYLDTVRLHMRSIADRKLSQIARADVKNIHAKASVKSERQADKAVAIVSSVYNYALDHELFNGVNPAGRIQKNPAPSRDRFAQAKELPYLLAAFADSSKADFFFLLLLTGARRSNLQAMAWSDLDLDSGIWRIESTKNGTPQNVTLSPEAVATLRARESTRSASSFVFPSNSKAGHIVEPKKAWADILRRASVRRLLDYLYQENHITVGELNEGRELVNQSPGIADSRFRATAAVLEIDNSHYDMSDLRMHDLRRTLGSWQARGGASLAIIGKSLNHKTHQATSIYARLDLDPVRESVNAAIKAMLSASTDVATKSRRGR
ncbi:tyrosine-type recombinase/integrase [Pseudomonas putida]